MSPSQLIRASGWADALAGAFFIIAEVLTPITLFTNPEALTVATLRAGIYPRGAAWLLVVGALVALGPLPYVNVPFDAAVAWLGIALMR